MRKIFNQKVIAIITIASIMTLTVNAQFNIGGPGTSGSGTFGNGTGSGSPVVPFDGGMSLLLAASGITFASKKLKVLTRK